jgi:leucyl aminopeptidase
MSLEISPLTALPTDQAIALFYFEGSQTATDGSATVAASALARRSFDGKVGQVACLDVDGRDVFVAGLGQQGELNGDTVRRAGALVIKAAAKTAPALTLSLAGVETDGLSGRDVTQAAVEGALLGTYRYGNYKAAKSESKLRELRVVGADEEGLRRGRLSAKATVLARDLVNGPPSDTTPQRIAEVAKESIGGGVTVNVWDEDRIRQERFGGLLGVAAGSSQPPRFIEMTYEPSSYERTLAIVGKGITFDSGGLSLKPPDGMMTMKTDMSGAADVIAVMSVIAELAPSCRVIAFTPLTENLPGPSATKPGDVLRARNGKTMEVLNTDAEGRLVLADALSLAVEQSPDAIIDLATLTGACVVALGGEIAGLMSNNDDLAAVVTQSASAAGEQVWRLPLPSQYRKHIDSEIADIKNTGAAKGHAGTLSAGLFLKEFVADIPWVHLDIAGPARSESDDGYLAKGASGFGVRTLIELLERW